MDHPEMIDIGIEPVQSVEGGMSVRTSGKIVVAVMIAAWMWASMSMLATVGASTHVAAAAASLTAEVHADTDEVRIEGRIDSGEGKWLTVVVLNPNRSIDYIDQIRSGREGSFLMAYRIGNPVEGTYTVQVHDAESDMRLTGTFEYLRSDPNGGPQPPPDSPADPQADPPEGPSTDPPPGSSNEPPPSTPSGQPAEAGDIRQQVESIIADLASLAAREALELAQAVIRSAAGLNDEEKSRIQDDLAALVQAVIRKAGTVDADEMDIRTEDRTTAVRLSETVIREKINLLDEAAERLAESLEAAGLDSASVMGPGRKELRIAWQEDGNRNVGIGLPAESFAHLAEHGMYLSVEIRGVAIAVPPGSFTGPDRNEWEEGAVIEISVSELDDEDVARFADSLRSSASEDNRFTLKGGVFDLNVTAAEGGNKTKLERFKAKVILEIPYSDTSGREEKFGVYRFDPENGSWQYVGGRVDPESRKVAARTQRFSHYAVMEYYRSFDDIKGHTAQDDIETLASKHILFGVDMSAFAPDRTITRAEAASILVRTLGMDLHSGGHAFRDVEAGAWYADIVGTVAEAGLMIGSAGQFRPGDRVTEEEMAVLAMRAYERFGGSQPGIDPEDDGRPAIRGDVSPWAVEAAASAARLGLIDSEFQPRRHATRAWSASVFRKLLDAVD